MLEKLEDRLYRVTCLAYGQTRRIVDIIKVMTDEQLSEAFGDLLEHALQSGEIDVSQGKEVRK
jgi:hypothetical protein